MPVHQCACAHPLHTERTEAPGSLVFKHTEMWEGCEVSCLSLPSPWPALSALSPDSGCPCGPLLVLLLSLEVHSTSLPGLALASIPPQLCPLTLPSLLQGHISINPDSEWGGR